jgi:hypothetical protein
MQNKTLNELLEMWSVLAPGQWDNTEGPEGWYAVCNDNGIVAYFADAPTAFRFRLAEINRAING